MKRCLKWLFRNREDAIFVITGLLVLILICGAAAYFGYRVYQARREVDVWREAYSEAVILGKSPDDVIATFGEPYTVLKEKDGSIRMFIYQGPLAAGVAVGFQDGVVVSVEDYILK